MVDSFKVACVGWSSRQDGPLARPRVLGATVDHAIARRRLACLSQLESFRDFDCAARV